MKTLLPKPKFMHKCLQFVIVLFFISCSSKQKSEVVAPTVTKTSLVILGTAQDAGSPQIACKKDCCKNLFENNINSANIDKKQINTIADRLKSFNPTVYRNIVEFKAQKLGPGEVLIYLIHDKVHLAGGTESGDVRIGSSMYEVKAAKLHRPGESGNTHSSNIATNFTFGSGIERKTDPIVKKIVELKNREDVKAGIDKQSFRKTASTTNIGTNELNYMRTNFASDFIPLEEEYAKEAAAALKAENQKLILINNNKNSIFFGYL